MDGSPGGAPGQAVLRLTGDVDAISQGRFRTRAEQLLATAPQRLVVDMAELTSIDSSGLGLLVHLQSLTRAGGVPMVLRKVPPRAAALLHRTGLDRVFAVDDDR